MATRRFSSKHGENIEILESGTRAKWNSTRSGGRVYCTTALQCEQTTFVKVTGSGHYSVGYICEDPALFPPARGKKPVFKKLIDVKIHKNQCVIPVRLDETGNGVQATYLDTAYRQMVEGSSHVWITVYMKFGDMIATVFQMASYEIPITFSRNRGTNIMLGDSNSSATLIKVNPAAICFLVQPLQVAETVHMRVQPITDGARQPRRYSMTVYAHNEDPEVLASKYKHLFSTSTLSSNSCPFATVTCLQNAACNGDVKVRILDKSTMECTHATGEVSIHQLKFNGSCDKMWLVFDLFRVTVTVAHARSQNETTTRVSSLQTPVNANKQHKIISKGSTIPIQFVPRTNQHNAENRAAPKTFISSINIPIARPLSQSQSSGRDAVDGEAMSFERRFADTRFVGHSEEFNMHQLTRTHELVRTGNNTAVLTVRTDSPSCAAGSIESNTSANVGACASESNTNLTNGMTEYRFNERLSNIESMMGKVVKLCSEALSVQRPQHSPQTMTTQSKQTNACSRLTNANLESKNADSRSTNANFRSAHATNLGSTLSAFRAPNTAIGLTDAVFQLTNGMPGSTESTHVAPRSTHPTFRSTNSIFGSVNAVSRSANVGLANPLASPTQDNTCEEYIAVEPESPDDDVETDGEHDWNSSDTRVDQLENQLDILTRTLKANTQAQIQNDMAYTDYLEVTRHLRPREDNRAVEAELPSQIRLVQDGGTVKAEMPSQIRLVQDGGTVKAEMPSQIRLVENGNKQLVDNSSVETNRHSRLANVNEQYVEIAF